MLPHISHSGRDGLALRNLSGVFWTIIGIVAFFAVLGILYWVSTKMKKPKPPVSPPPRRVPKSPTPLVSATIRCPSCGFRNAVDHAFCGRCGALLCLRKRTLEFTNHVNDVRALPLECKFKTKYKLLDMDGISENDTWHYLK